MKFKIFLRHFITILFLTVICHIIDAFMEFYDYRFMIGIAVSAALFTPTNLWLKNKFKFLS